MEPTLIFPVGRKSPSNAKRPSGRERSSCSSPQGGLPVESGFLRPCALSDRPNPSKVRQCTHGSVILACRIARCPVLVIDLIFWGERLTLSLPVPTKMSWLSVIPTCVLAYDDYVKAFSLDGARFVDGMLRLRMVMGGSRPPDYLASNDSKGVLVEFQRVSSCVAVDYSRTLAAFHSWWADQSRELIQPWQRTARVATHSRVSSRYKKNTLSPNPNESHRTTKCRRYSPSKYGVSTLLTGRVLLCEVSLALGMGVDLSICAGVESGDCVRSAELEIKKCFHTPSPVSEYDGKPRFTMSHFSAPRSAVTYHPPLGRRVRWNEGAVRFGRRVSGDFRSRHWLVPFPPALGGSSPVYSNTRIPLWVHRFVRSHCSQKRPLCRVSVDA